MPRFNRPSQGLVFSFLLFVLSAGVRAQSRDQIAPTLSLAHHSFTVFAPRGHSNALKTNLGQPFDSIQSFDGSFQATGVSPTGTPRRNWFYTMAGSRPEQGGTTTFNAPIVPVSLDLLDHDGSVRVVNGQKLHYSVQPFIAPVLESPIFQNTARSSKRNSSE